MPYIIQHPARVDLFDDGKEWGPLASAKHYASEEIAAYFTEPGDRVIPAPEVQPIHPLSPTNL